MPRSFKLPDLSAISVKDPRVVVRAAIGVLVAANLAAAVMAFHPFGGGADDLRRERQALSAQLAQLQARLRSGKELVAKVQTARAQGDDFLNQYFMSSQAEAALILAELNKSETDAGIRVRTEAFTEDDIEGTNTLHRLTTQVGLEGTYAGLAKFVNLLDKSPRFLIIESMNASAPQQQDTKGPRSQPDQLNVTLKIDAFIKDVPGAAL